MELETDGGREAAIYGPGPEYAVRGVTFVPLELLAEESLPPVPKFPLPQ